MENSVESYINAQPEQAIDFNQFYNDYGRNKYGEEWNDMDPDWWFTKVGNFFTGDVDYAKNRYEAYLTNLKNRNEFISQQAARSWDKLMDDTKYQRMMKDLEAAGLNPYLLVNNGGISASSAPTSAKANYDMHSMKKAEKNSGNAKQVAGAAAAILAIIKVAAMFL